MTIRRTLTLTLPALGLALAPGAAPLRAQGIEGQVGRFYEDGGWDLYRLGLNRRVTGVLGLGLHGNYLRRADGGDGAFAGISTDLTAFKGGTQGPYLVAGVGGGMGSPQSGDLSSLWGSWSAGAGYELFPTSFLAFGAEARWRELSLDRRNGVEVAAGLSIRFGGHRGARPRPTTTPTIASDAGIPSATEIPSASSAEVSDTATPSTVEDSAQPLPLREAVIATARRAMGRPYSWGGTGEDGGGFDCSGLIQHAYGQHGIALPRTSVEQAKEGRAVARKLGALAPGDLLTFSNRGGPVSHVGLYIGEGRFIHSASRGVQISVLSGDDPYGRWWYQRWVGVRRIINH
jgi:cell wall-associated NlpC family hydrolase